MKTAIAILSMSALLVGGQALAQQAVDPVVTLKLPRSTVQQIGNALMKAPYETSAPILQELQRQLVEADQVAKPPATVAPNEPGGQTAPQPPKNQ